MFCNTNEWFRSEEQKWRWMCRLWRAPAHDNAQANVKWSNKTIWLCDAINDWIHENWPQFHVLIDRSQDLFILRKRCQWYGEPVWLRAYSKDIFQDNYVHFPSLIHYWKIALQNSRFSRFSRMRGNPVKLQKKRRNGGKNTEEKEQINRCLLPPCKNHANSTNLSWESETILFILQHTLRLTTNYSNLTGPERASSLPPAAAQWQVQHNASQEALITHLGLHLIHFCVLKRGKWSIHCASEHDYSKFQSTKCWAVAPI